MQFGRQRKEGRIAVEDIFEIIMEIVIELVFEGSFETAKSSRIPKYIRYPLIGIIILFIIAVIGLIFFAGILSLKENIFAGIILILVGLLLLIMSAVKLRKAYLTKYTKQ